MILRGQLPQRCDILRRAAGTGDAGEANGAWASLATDVPCKFSAGSGSERLEDRTLAIQPAQFMFLPDQDVAPADRLLFDGMTWEVIGPPAKRFAASARAHHISASALLVE
jgi:hypothetical protein